MFAFGPKSPQVSYPPGIAEGLAELGGSGEDCLLSTPGRMSDLTAALKSNSAPALSEPNDKNNNLFHDPDLYGFCVTLADGN